MFLDFKISDFNISGEAIPEHVADVILEHHITPMQDVSDCMVVSVSPSIKSSYRSLKWEKEHGRSGSSQHCFGEKEDGTFDKDAKGATDWKCDNFIELKDELLKLIIDHTNYTRLCIYNTFIHCDFKKTSSGERQLFKINNGRWKFIKNID
ncbi:MAG: hypothetical protein QQN55_01005 [Nitrosopumilus sp.]